MGKVAKPGNAWRSRGLTSSDDLSGELRDENKLTKTCSFDTHLYTRARARRERNSTYIIFLESEAFSRALNSLDHKLNCSLRMTRTRFIVNGRKVIRLRADVRGRKRGIADISFFFFFKYFCFDSLLLCFFFFLRSLINVKYIMRFKKNLAL